MKAVIINKFGNRDQLTLANIATPTPTAGEVLIRVSYAGVNPVDWKIREGYLQSLFPHLFPLVPGWDVAGEVVAKGPGVKDFRVGDRVYAYARKATVQGGTYAEFVTVAAENVAPTPKALTDAQASAVPLTALTAWQALFDFGRLGDGQTVLIHAGAGGVGSFAIQIAKSAGAKVLTTGSKEKHHYLLGLGADVVIDYRDESFQDTVSKLYPNGVDLVIDGVGGETLNESFALLKRGGTLVSIVDTPNAETAAAHGVNATLMFVAPSGEQLRKIAGLIDRGLVKMPQIEVLPLEEAAEAHRKSETRRTVGKIVLKV